MHAACLYKTVQRINQQCTKSQYFLHSLRKSAEKTTSNENIVRTINESITKMNARYDPITNKNDETSARSVNRQKQRQRRDVVVALPAIGMKLLGLCLVMLIEALPTLLRRQPETSDVRRQDGRYAMMPSTTFSSSAAAAGTAAAERRDSDVLPLVRGDVVYQRGRRRSTLIESERSKTDGRGMRRLPVSAMEAKSMASSTTWMKHYYYVKDEDERTIGSSVSQRRLRRRRRRHERHARCVSQCGLFRGGPGQVCVQWCEIGMPIDVSSLVRRLWAVVLNVVTARSFTR